MVSKAISISHLCFLYFVVLSSFVSNHTSCPCFLSLHCDWLSLASLVSPVSYKPSLCPCISFTLCLVLAWMFLISSLGQLWFWPSPNPTPSKHFILSLEWNERCLKWARSACNVCTWGACCLFPRRCRQGSCFWGKCKRLNDAMFLMCENLMTSGSAGS